MDRVCRLRCSNRTNRASHSEHFHFLGQSSEDVVGTLRPRVFFVRPGTGTGSSVDRERLGLGIVGMFDLVVGRSVLGLDTGN